MDETQDLNHIIRRHTVDHQVSRATNAVFRDNQPARQMKMIGSNARKPRNLARAGPVRGFFDGG